MPQAIQPGSTFSSAPRNTIPPRQQQTRGARGVVGPLFDRLQRWPAAIRQLQAFPAGFMDLIDRDVEQAMPVFERTAVAFITRPASQTPLDNDIFAPERSIAVAAGRSENGNDGRPYGSSKMHRSSIAADEKPCHFAKCNEFLKIRLNFAHARTADAFETPNHIFFARPRGHDDREALAQKPCR